jgi:hypothetical protein
MKYTVLFAILWHLATALPAQSYGDCANAYIVCNNKIPIQIPEIPDAGKNEKEIAGSNCSNIPFPETNVVWLVWEVEKPGRLGFTLVPLNESDDLDFVLYRTAVKGNHCRNRSEIACTLAGPPRAEDFARTGSNCTGATGLRQQPGSASKTIGCSDDSDKFLADIEVKAGEQYVLFVNNYLSEKGFLLEFTGDCTFREIPGNCIPQSPISIKEQSSGNVRFSDLYPNPSAHRIFSDIYSENDLSGNVDLIDLNGRLIESRKIQIGKGDNQIETDVESLAAGIYYLKIRLGEDVFLGRFCKIHGQ